jgi:hypothetical protein
VVTWQGNDTLTLYVDGVEVTNLEKLDDFTSEMMDDPRRIFIANRWEDTRLLRCHYHSVSVWNAELTAAEVAQLYVLGVGASLTNDYLGYASAANLKHWFKLGENPNDMGYDYVQPSTVDVDSFSVGVRPQDDNVYDVP